MIEVGAVDAATGKPTTIVFDTSNCEILDAALIIRAPDADRVLAGFAPGSWLTFQILDGDGRPMT